MSLYVTSAFTLSANNYSGNIEIDVTVGSSGAGRVDFMLWNSDGTNGLNGYLFVYSAINGEQPGQIYRVDNGVATSIATYDASVNSAQLAGEFSMKMIYYAAAGLFLLYLNSAVVATAKDTTYAVNGPVGYGSEAVTGTVRNDFRIHSPSPAQTGGNLLNNAGQLQGDAQVLNSYINAPAVAMTVSFGSTINFSAASLVVADASGSNQTLQNVSISGLALSSLQLDTGSWSGGTPYFLYLVYNGMYYQLLASLNSTAPDLTGIMGPGGAYRYFKKVSFIFITLLSGGNPYAALQFAQSGTMYQYRANMAAGGTTGALFFLVDLSNYIPAGISNIGIFSLGVSSWTSGNVGAIISADGTNPYAISAMVSGAAWQGPQASFEMVISNPQRAWVAQNGGGSGTAELYVCGCILNI